ERAGEPALRPELRPMAPLDGDPPPSPVPRAGTGGLAGRAHALPVRRPLYGRPQRVRVGRRVLSAMQPRDGAGTHRGAGPDRARHTPRLTRSRRIPNRRAAAGAAARAGPARRPPRLSGPPGLAWRPPLARRAPGRLAEIALVPVGEEPPPVGALHWRRP